MKHFDWDASVTVENYHPEGRKKKSRATKPEVADCGHSCLLDIIFFNLKAQILPVNLNVIFNITALKILGVCA